MLAHLSIRNFAIIDATELEFGPGLNALTGQTGAGKSIIVDAIGLVLGERARADLIREGCRRAEVSALFLLPPSDVIAERLQALDLLVDSAQTDTTELVIRRTITQGGKGRVYINGSLSTLRTLIDLTRGIIDISSQHAHTSLLKPGTHLALLDRFGELTKERHSYATIWREITAARGKCDALKHRMEHQLEQEDFLRFQLSELEALAPDPERDQGLEDERKQLRMSDKHHGGYKGAESSLNNGPGSACDSLDSALMNLEPILEDQALLTPILKRLRSARIEIEDIAFELHRCGETLRPDPVRLEAVESRIHALKRAQRKHRVDLAGLVAHQDHLQREVASFEHLEDEIIEGEALIKSLESEGLRLAQSLSDARASVATRLAGQVSAELVSLHMKSANVVVNQVRGKTLHANGIDEVEFLLQANEGLSAKPLDRVASGGELSRLQLGFKRTLAAVDDVRTALFDEVDSGVGGAVGEVIGLKLKEIAQERQVIVITHLAQIAAMAEHHLVVQKSAQEGRTICSVKVIDLDARREEVARMLGGLKITKKTRDHAAELLANNDHDIPKSLLYGR